MMYVNIMETSLDINIKIAIFTTIHQYLETFSTTHTSLMLLDTSAFQQNISNVAHLKI